MGSESTYVVMVREDDGTWGEVATVAVPSRSKRRTVIEKALEEFGPDRGFKSERLQLRVLDADAAHVTTVEWEQPPPRLKIADLEPVAVDGPPDMG